MAGSELLLAVEEEIGAVQHLSETVKEHLSSLPGRHAGVVDDSGDRDERGRFESSYNEPYSRTSPELGGKFDTLKRRCAEKNLSAMRVANSTLGSLYRKDLTLTFSPILVEGGHLSELGYWRGGHFESLFGIGYQPETLTKHTRELKFAGASSACKESVAAFWLDNGEVLDPMTGAAVVYVDASVKPLHTHHFTRSTKVSANGRVQPAMSTVMLNNGVGTPLFYGTFSGHVSVPKQIPKLLRAYETKAGEGTARRVVVLDRESHAVWLFKELDRSRWTFSSKPMT